MGPARLHPDYPGECWVPEHNTSYKVNTQWQTTHMGCIAASCVSYRNTLYIQYLTCGVIGVESGCETVADLTLPYPACCPNVTPTHTHTHTR
ncbi:hypothetical protein Pmani_035870 [Petrolisthes manimaculis]|uniref:Single domain-containing protein n=1 Tax=Petrolisthes manimaculis TaxID=1843537 RepID=A0AAE1NKS4_9EUCA|nr:hypothetical protein Pmani_035870 [Petrolisthes manimaculis]